MKIDTIIPVAVLALVSLALPVQSWAQEEEPTETWKGEVGLAVTSSGGNENLTVITTELGLSHLRTERYELNLGTRFRYGRSDGEEVAQNLRGSVNLDLFPRAPWSPFLFSTAEQDPFRKLDLRLNSGAGVKRTFWQDEWDEVSLSAAVLHSYENVEVTPVDSVSGITGNDITQNARWSWRGRARRQLGEGSRVEQIVFFQPAFNYAEDYLLEAQSTVRFSLTQSLAFTSMILYSRDSTPAPEVDPDDWSVAVGLTMATTW